MERGVKPRALIFEEETDTAEKTEGALDRMGFEPIAIRSANETQELLSNRRSTIQNTELAFVHIRFPGGNDFGARNILLRLKEWSPQIVNVAYSGYVSPGDRQWQQCVPVADLLESRAPGTLSFVDKGVQLLREKIIKSETYEILIRDNASSTLDAVHTLRNYIASAGIYLSGLRSLYEQELLHPDAQDVIDGLGAVLTHESNFVDRSLDESGSAAGDLVETNFGSVIEAAVEDVDYLMRDKSLDIVIDQKFDALKVITADQRLRMLLRRSLIEAIRQAKDGTTLRLEQFSRAPVHQRRIWECGDQWYEISGIPLVKAALKWEPEEQLMFNTQSQGIQRAFEPTESTFWGTASILANRLQGHMVLARSGKHALNLGLWLMAGVEPH